MSRKILLILMVLFLLLPVDVEAAPAGEFATEKAFEHIKYLAQKIGPRPPGSSSELKAAQYIAGFLEQNGWKVRTQPFTQVVLRRDSPLSSEERATVVSSQNIIAELPGKSPDTVVLGAHYDSAPTSPGAVDNASGVGLLLEVGRLLGKEHHDLTYQLVFFGAEEAGLVGSTYYAAAEDLSAVRWMLNIDMVGLPLNIDIAGKISAPPDLLEQMAALARSQHLPFHVSRDFLVMARDSQDGGASDFSSLLDQGIPAVGLGIAGRPPGYYHRPEDRVGCVNMEELQQFGDYVLNLLQTVRVGEAGSRIWDNSYLPFRIGNWVLIMPGIGLRLFYMFAFLFTGFTCVRVLKREHPLRLRDAAWVIVVSLCVAVVVVAASALGDVAWSWAKGLQAPWTAHPGLFLLARVLGGSMVLLLLGSLLPRLRLPRQPELYWFIAVISMSILSALLAFTRLDLAFPLVFWLACLNIQQYRPSFPLVVLGPYFVLRFHWELLNSQQWLSFYEAMHKHFRIFLFFYSGLLFLFVVALMHLAVSRQGFWHRLVRWSKTFALPGIVLVFLGLGLVPAYSEKYPQSLLVQQEWLPGEVGRLRISSQERLPAQLEQDLFGNTSNKLVHRNSAKSIVMRSISDEAPLHVRTTVSEKPGQNRVLDLVLQFGLNREPYLVRLKLESQEPFRIQQTTGFLPMSKMPKKLTLTGKRLHQGSPYTLVLERTPPYSQNAQFTVEAPTNITCTVEGFFPGTSGPLEIRERNLSVEYQDYVQERLSF